jgi:uncharacterized protein YbaP (TraB family)
MILMCECYARFMHKRVACALVAAAAAAVSLSAQPPAPAPSSASTRHFLWTVTSQGAPPSYLLGSLHVLTPDYYPLPARIDQAFGASKVLIEEADLDEVNNPAMVMSLVGKAMLSDGRTLDQLIPPPLHAQVMERADKLGLPRAAVQRMKPWLVALSLTQPALEAAGFKAEHGVDMHFFERAKKAGMTRRALETVAFQFDRLDQLTPPQQESLLRSTIDEIDTQIANVKAIADAWKSGDTAAVEKLLLTSMTSSPDLYQTMLVARNASWVPSVEACLKEQTSCFIVVGAAHLVGPDSLVAMLQKKGYKVEQQ